MKTTTTTICSTRIRTVGRVKHRGSFVFKLEAARGGSGYTNLITTNAAGVRENAKTVEVGVEVASLVKLRDYCNAVLKAAATT